MALWVGHPCRRSGRRGWSSFVGVVVCVRLVGLDGLRCLVHGVLDDVLDVVAVPECEIAGVIDECSGRESLPPVGFLGPAPTSLLAVPAASDWVVSAPHATPWLVAATSPKHTAKTARRYRPGDGEIRFAVRRSSTVIDVPFDIASWCADSLPTRTGSADAYTTPKGLTSGDVSLGYRRTRRPLRGASLQRRVKMSRCLGNPAGTSSRRQIVDAVDLVEIEALKQLKARYCRLLDAKDWQAWRGLFTDDFISDTSKAGGKVIHGADHFVAFTRSHLKKSSQATAHQVHAPELELTSATTAAGIWALEDVVRLAPGVNLRGYGRVRTYERVDGQWLLKTSTLTRLREDFFNAFVSVRLRPHEEGGRPDDAESRRRQTLADRRCARLCES